MIKKTLALLFALVTLGSCGNTTSRQFCIFLEEATERVEKANSLNEINTVNDKLIKNITIYSMSLEEEEYKRWENDQEAQHQLQEAQMKYQTAKQAREKELSGK